MTLGDRIVIMKDGFIQQVGTPTEVFDEPDNLFVAEFIGAPKMNIFNCKLIRSNEGYFVRPFDATIPVDGPKGDRLAELNIKPQEIVLGVRPEHIVLAEEGAPEAFPVTIEVNEMMGSELHLHVYTDDETRLIVRVPTMTLSPEMRAAMVYGARMWLTFSANVMHFFDDETKHNILKIETNDIY
jgi:multiple sugar transport system ATP-binding protein